MDRIRFVDETLAEAHAALGYVHLAFDWDGPAAEQSLLRALDLNPTLVRRPRTTGCSLHDDRQLPDALTAYEPR